MNSEEESKRIRKESYSYCEWRLRLGRCRKRGRFFDGYTKQYEVFEEDPSLLRYFFLIFASIVLCSVHVCMLYLFEIPKVCYGIISAFYILSGFSLFYYLDYLFLPTWGRIAFDKGIIDKEQMLIISKRRFPANFVLPSFREAEDNKVIASPKLSDSDKNRE